MKKFYNYLVVNFHNVVSVIFYQRDQTCFIAIINCKYRVLSCFFSTYLFVIQIVIFTD